MVEDFRYLSVCSGIEAFSVAVDDLDFTPAGFCEIEDFPSRVLAHRYPDVPNHGDMTKIETGRLGRIDWLVGGTPCQSFSVAGLRLGLDDDRGNLSLEYVRLAHELADENGLRGFLWENVPGVLSDKSNAFGCFLGAVIGHDGPLLPGDKPGYGRSNKFWRWIAAREKEPIYDDEGQDTGEFTIAAEGYHRPIWPNFGMASGPRARVAWRVLDSRHFGVAQRRRRVFVVADFGNGADPAAVLFEPRGQGRSAAPSRKARQDVAGTLGGSSQSGGVRTTDLDGSGAFIPVYSGNAEGGNADLPSMNASNGKKGVNNQTPLVSVFDPNQITSKANRSRPETEMAHTLPAAPNSPVVFAIQERAVSENPNAGPDGIGAQADIAYTMEARSQVQAVAFGSKDHGADAGDISPTLKASGHTGSHANGGAPPAVAFSMMPQNSGKDFKAREVDILQPLMASGPSHGDQGGDVILNGPQVRRLTPEECEKLQGFPIGWTRIPGLSGWRDLGPDENPDELRDQGHEVRTNKKTGKSRVNDPDGPRYKALGNSFTTEPVNWIMSRVQASLRGETMPRWQPMQLWLNPSQ